MSRDRSPTPMCCTVKAPAGYANAELNGERVMLLTTWEDIATTMILSGQHAGRYWQFNASHLEPRRG